MFRKNRVVTVEGPFGDLEDLDEKQRRKQLVMRLRVLDLRENKLQSIFLIDAASFLRETVVLMWDNPFNIDSSGSFAKEYNDPQHLFRASADFDDDYKMIRNPLHIFCKPPENDTFINSLLEEL